MCGSEFVDTGDGIPCCGLSLECHLHKRHVIHNCPWLTLKVINSTKIRCSHKQTLFINITNHMVRIFNLWYASHECSGVEIVYLFGSPLNMDSLRIVINFTVNGSSCIRVE